MSESEVAKRRKSIAAKKRWASLDRNSEEFQKMNKKRSEALRKYWASLSAEERRELGRKSAEARRGAKPNGNGKG